MWRWLLVLLIVGQVAAQEMRIAELQLEGCRVTDPQKVLVAIGFKPGMPYDAERLRRALMELGLFESVTLETTETTEGLQVTAEVKEKNFPAPTTEDAARALNPVAVARRWLNGAYRSPLLPLAEDKTVSIPTDFAFFTPRGYAETPMELIDKLLGKAPWVKEALKATDEGAARKTLLVELERHLKRSLMMLGLGSFSLICLLLKGDMRRRSDRSPLYWRAVPISPSLTWGDCIWQPFGYLLTFRAN